MPNFSTDRLSRFVARMERLGDLPGHEFRGNQWTGSSVSFEVAPDPNDAELANEWRALSPAEKIQISKRVSRAIVPSVIESLGVEGTIREQVGSYLDDTNPSFSLRLASNDNPLEVAKAIGFALSQDSMVAVSAKPFDGSSEVGAVAVETGKMSAEYIARTYAMLREIKIDGEQVVSGQSSSAGRMLILNFSNASTDALAEAVDKALGEKFQLHVRTVHAAFPGKEDYDYADPKNDGQDGRGDLRRRARDLRARASAEVRKEIDAAKARAQKVVEKHGDFVGHPFRGNQWTGGHGGGGVRVNSDSRFAGTPAKWDLTKATPEETKVAAERARAYTKAARLEHSVPILIAESDLMSKDHADIVEAQVHAGILGASRLARDMMEEDGWKVVVDTSTKSNDMPGGTVLAVTSVDKKHVVLSYDAVMSDGFKSSGATGDMENEAPVPRVRQQVFQHEMGHVEVYAMQKAALGRAMAGDFGPLRELSGAFFDLTDAVDTEGGATSYIRHEASQQDRAKDLGSPIVAFHSSKGVQGGFLQSLVPTYLNETFAEMRGIVEAALWESKKTGLADVDAKFPKAVKAYARLRALVGRLAAMPKPKGISFTHRNRRINKDQDIIGFSEDIVGVRTDY